MVSLLRYPAQDEGKGGMVGEEWWVVTKSLFHCQVHARTSSGSMTNSKQTKDLRDDLRSLQILLTRICCWLIVDSLRS